MYVKTHNVGGISYHLQNYGSVWGLTLKPCTDRQRQATLVSNDQLPATNLLFMLAEIFLSVQLKFAQCGQCRQSPVIYWKLINGVVNEVN